MSENSNKNRALLRRMRFAIPLLLIPLCAVLGTVLFDEKRHIFVSVAVAFLSLAFFYLGFEEKNTGSRRAVIVSVMIALSVIGRFIPLLKPVTAITVICAVYLGAESGFLVGSLSALLSNIAFGQGPWTPFQMLAWGIIGLLAGIFAKMLKKSRTALIAYGALSGIAFSLVMDVWTTLWYSGGFDIALYLSALLTSLPHTLIYAVSNVIFLYVMAKPIGEKLDRIIIKYGI